MKQLLQNLKTGDTYLEEVPVPAVKSGHVLIQTMYSLVSAGTERMLVEFGKSGWFSKARQQPEKVQQVIDKVKTDGILATYQAIKTKIDTPIPLGYSNVGKVVAVGEDILDIRVGDVVVSNGPHAEVTMVPRNLVAVVVTGVKPEHATFTVIGAIGLQGIRLAKPTLGETFVVAGLGLIGQLTAQMLIANGCEVIGYDTDEAKVKLANKIGIKAVCIPAKQSAIDYLKPFCPESGADGVIITASSKSNDIIADAAKICRKKGRVILTGVVGLDLNRSDFYEKEISFQVSCSYGPGRYDAHYELEGMDYPIGYVRWTENRNFEAVLQLLNNGKLNVQPLISNVVNFEDFNQVYDSMHQSKAIATLFKYNSNVDLDFKTVSYSNGAKSQLSKLSIGLIGAGNYVNATLLPILSKLNIPINVIASSGGVSSSNIAKKFNIQFATTDTHQIISGDSTNAIIVATRHHTHAHFVSQALTAGKHVFVEKPLAINLAGLEQIKEAYNNSSKTLTVGFNRRFSKHAKAIQPIIAERPVQIIATINAGHVNEKSWIQNVNEGGGRIIGEACHFVDLMAYLTSSRVTRVCANTSGINPGTNSDIMSIQLSFANGSIGVINYFSNGSSKYPKERIEVFGNGTTMVINNFRQTRAYGVSKFKSIKTRSIDKGHATQFMEWKEALIKGESLIPFESVVNTTKTTFAILESITQDTWIDVE